VACQHHDGEAACRQWESGMTEQHSTFFGMRTHHVVIALIAIVIAVALASNYYLW
jgi:hypothetical protein